MCVQSFHLQKKTCACRLLVKGKLAPNVFSTNLANCGQMKSTFTNRIILTPDTQGKIALFQQCDFGTRARDILAREY